MPLLSNQQKKTLYVTPVTKVGKFVSRVNRPEEYDEPNVYQRVLVKTGATVHERRYDTITGRIVGFDVMVARDQNYDSQYRVLIVNDEEPDVEGALVVGVNSSLGRQLMNQLLSLTPSDLQRPVTFTFRATERDGQQRGYLNLYYGTSPAREYAVPRRYQLEDVPAPTTRQNKTKGGALEYDYTATNEFFFDQVETVRAAIAEAHRLSGAGRPAPETPAAGDGSDFADEFDPQAYDHADAGHRPAAAATGAAATGAAAVGAAAAGAAAAGGRLLSSTTTPATAPRKTERSSVPQERSRGAGAATAVGDEPTSDDLPF